MKGISFNIPTALLCAVIGYLIGNFQTAIIVSRTRYHEDIRDMGSGNPGSTNVLRVYGGLPALITFVGDFLKAILAVIIGRSLMQDAGGYFSGLFVVIGHVFPVFYRFKGGKGVASSIAVGMLLYPAGAFIALGVAVIVFFAFERVSLSSLSWTLVYIILSVIFKRWDVIFIICAVINALLIFYCHRDNINRLIHKKEPKMKLKISKLFKKR